MVTAHRQRRSQRSSPAHHQQLLAACVLACLAPPTAPKTCAGNGAATLRPSQPYRALWNAAWPEKPWAIKSLSADIHVKVLETAVIVCIFEHV
jgi:hypothetical protein